MKVYGTSFVAMKNQTLNVLKGFAIVLVVYGHVIQRTMVVAGQDFFSHPVFKIIYTFHLPLFVFISGYLLAFSLQRRSLRAVFLTRCKSLLIPFAVWSILDLLINSFLSKMDGNGEPIHWGQEIVQYLFVNPAVWFLFMLFMMSCVLLWSVKLQNRLGLAAFGIVYAGILIIPVNEYAAVYYVKWFYLFYLAGYCVNRYVMKIIAKFNNALVLGGSLILFSVLAGYWTKTDYIYVNKMNFLTADYGFEVLRFAYRYCVGFMGIIAMFFLGAYVSKNKLGHVLGFIGVYSLDIYLLQRYLVEGFYPRLLARTGWSFDFYSPFFLFIFAPAIVVLAILLCAIISRFFLRSIPLFNLFFLGHRQQ